MHERRRDWEAARATYQQMLAAMDGGNLATVDVAEGRAMATFGVARVLKRQGKHKQVRVALNQCSPLLASCAVCVRVHRPNRVRPGVGACGASVHCPPTSPLALES